MWYIYIYTKYIYIYICIYMHGGFPSHGWHLVWTSHQITSRRSNWRKISCSHLEGAQGTCAETHNDAFVAAELFGAHHLNRSIDTHGRFVIACWDSEIKLWCFILVRPGKIWNERRSERNNVCYFHPYMTVLGKSVRLCGEKVVSRGSSSGTKSPAICCPSQMTCSYLGSPQHLRSSCNWWRDKCRHVSWQRGVRKILWSFNLAMQNPSKCSSVLTSAVVLVLVNISVSTIRH